MLRRSGQGFGHGKLILFGEHAVVHGQPAVAAALDRGATASVRSIDAPIVRLLIDGRPVDTAHSGDDARLHRAFEAICEVLAIAPEHLEVDVSLDLFAGAGLGSSAALSVAIARALLDAANETTSLSGAELDALVEGATRASEEVFHGKPSGVDQSAAMGRGLFRFQRLPEAGITLTPLQAPVFDVAVCLAGPPSSTARMVAAVAAQKERFPDIAGEIHRTIGAIATAGAEALCAGDLPRVGELMNLNQGLLAALGVSTATLDEACHLARNTGALGAKLTGAGGGGCAIAIAAPDAIGPILEAWKSREWPAFHARIRSGLHTFDRSLSS